MISLQRYTLRAVCSHRHFITFSPQHFLQDKAKVAVVINDEDVRHADVPYRGYGLRPASHHLIREGLCRSTNITR